MAMRRVEGSPDRWRREKLCVRGNVFVGVCHKNESCWFFFVVQLAINLWHMRYVMSKEPYTIRVHRKQLLEYLALNYLFSKKCNIFCYIELKVNRNMPDHSHFSEGGTDNTPVMHRWIWFINCIFICLQYEKIWLCEILATGFNVSVFDS